MSGLTLTYNEERKQLIAGALEMAAKGMEALYSAPIIDGTHHLGKYYFFLKGKTELFVAAYKPAIAPNATMRGTDFDNGRSGVFEDGEYVSVPQRQEMILITAQESMPAVVAIALLSQR